MELSKTTLEELVKEPARPDGCADWIRETQGCVRYLSTMRHEEIQEWVTFSQCCEP